MNAARLYIPIETKIREFDAKLLLSCVAAEAGHEAVLGHQKVILKKIEKMPPGILIDKSVLPRKIGKYWHYKKLGFKVVAYDEEGLIPWSDDEYQRLREFSDQTLEPLEYFFAWGQWQADFVSGKTSAYREKIVQVGHPRMDLTRKELRGFYEDDVEALRDRYGRFILINSNFSVCNHFFGNDLMEAKKHVWDETLQAFYKKLGAFQDKLFEAFTEMMIALRQRFPDRTVVLRPHPSENHDSWRQVLPQDEKIIVVHEGNVLPWLMAAEVMIHNNCTTGIEAYLLEQPVIAYRPVQDQVFDKALPNGVSDQEFTLNSLLERVECYLTDDSSVHPLGDTKKQELTARYIAGLEGFLSCERIISSLSDVQIPQKSLGALAYQFYTKAKNIGRKVMRGGTQKKTSSTSKIDRRQYKSQKFPGIELDEIYHSIAKFQQLTGRFSQIHPLQLQKNLFRITCGE